MADKHYRIHAPFYRLGVYYERGSVVSLPEGELPSKQWQEVDAEGYPLERAKAAPAPEPVKPTAPAPGPKKVLG